MLASDVLRPLSLQLQRIGPAERIDLLLATNGGAVDAPWKIVSLIREYTRDFRVLLPSYAFSGGTLLALGADEIVTCPESLLGPVDPQMWLQNPGTFEQRSTSVEDIMAFLQFGRDEANIMDQQALSRMVSELAVDLKPPTLGSMYRMYSYIRFVAKRLLQSRREKFDAMVEDRIIEALAEKSYTHGHGIGPTEALDIGLPIQKADGTLQSLMRQLHEQYIDLFTMDVPAEIPRLRGNEAHQLSLLHAALESVDLLHVYDSILEIRAQLGVPQQLNIQVSPNIQLPANIPANNLPQARRGPIASHRKSIAARIREQYCPAGDGAVARDWR